MEEFINEYFELIDENKVSSSGQTFLFKGKSIETVYCNNKS